MRSVFIGTALTTVMLVALPFVSSASLSAGTASAIDAQVVVPDPVATGATGQSSSTSSTEFTFADASPATEGGDPLGGSSDSRGASSPDATTESSTSSGTGSSGPSVSTGSIPQLVASGQDDVITLPVVVDATPTAPACPAAISGSVPGAPSRTSPLGVAGTTTDDLQSFAVRYNEIRVANCLAPVPFANIRYDACMEDRLFWMAEDPSTDPMSAWGHIGSERSDGVPSVGCDGNLAGGSNNTGVTVAQKWWDSSGHRTSLYKPTFTGNTSGVCILFAMTHGGVPNEPYSFTRAAARWTTC